MKEKYIEFYKKLDEPYQSLAIQRINEDPKFCEVKKEPPANIYQALMFGFAWGMHGEKEHKMWRGLFYKL